MGLDAFSITFSDSFDDAIFEPPVGKTPFMADTTVNSLFNVDVEQTHVQMMLKQICNIRQASFELLKNCIWEDECKKDFHRIQFVKKIWIYPSW